MELAFSTLAPVVILVVLGFALRAFKFLPAAFFTQLNRLVFWVALPAVLFIETAQARLATGAAARTAGAMLLANLLVALLAAIPALCMRLPAPTFRAFVQGAFRGNYSYVGLPVVFFAMPDESSHPAILLALAGLTIVNNMWAVLLLTPFEKGAKDMGFAAVALRAVAAIFKNPLVVSCVLGVAASALKARAGWDVPDCMAKALKATGGISMGGALIALGAGLELDRLRGVIGLAAGSTFFRLVACPLLGLLTTRLLGVSGDLRLAALLFIATPAAVASYVMADQMNADRELAGSIVVLSTIVALPTMAAVLAMV